jgi:rSAM/selenodomain-associated transferase 1
MTDKQTLIIFTRYPEKGKTKTRLIPLLGAEGSANLQRKMTEETVKKAKILQSKLKININIYFTEGNEKLMSEWLGNDLVFKTQREGDLGQKMQEAFQEAFNNHNQQVVLIGVDCPKLDEVILQEAFKSSQNHDLVIGPALDGGYYLIGLNRLIPELFQGINWGSSEVFNQTKNIAQNLGLKIHYLPQLYDIDRPEDLQLIDCPPYPPTLGGIPTPSPPDLGG